MLEFLTSLHAAGVTLSVDGGRLRVAAPDGALTPALRDEIAKRKDAIVSFLGDVGGNSLGLVIPRSKRNGDLPLSFAQERLWFLHQLEEHTSRYNIPMALQLSGALDEGLLRQCLTEVVRRHEALRTRFKVVAGRPAQTIDPMTSLEMPTFDLSKVPQPARDAEAKRLCADEARHPFNLAEGVFLRATLVRLGATEHILLLTMHHIASDGWSLGVLLSELAAIYGAYGKGLPSPLPELPIQYADFAVWQRQFFQGEVLERQLTYWKKHLAGAPTLLELPYDRPRPLRQSYHGGIHCAELPTVLAEDLKKLSRAQNVTVFMTLLAAFQTLLHRYTRIEDILVGTPIAGRNRAETEKLIGFFVNTLVMRGDFSGNPTFRELLNRTRDVALQAYAHQDLPFERLVQELQPQRSMGHEPVFQVLFAFQNTPAVWLDLPGLNVTPVQIDTGTSKFDLTFAVRESEESYQIAVDYNTDLFDAQTVGRLIGHYQTLLEAIVSNAGQRISDLPLLTQREQQQILEEWNQTEKDYSRDRCLHELVEEQVARTPDAVAVACHGKLITYQELNVRANRLAHHLRQLGVEPDDLVAICVERGIDMLVGLLAVLKAGGAYVPLDPAYPVERLRYMMEDSAPKVLLTQGRLKGLFEKLRKPPAVIDLDTANPPWANQPVNNPARIGSGPTPGHLAYVIYTSGSTGTPKGVMVEHRNVTRLFAATDAWFQFGADDVWTLFHSYAFDFSVWEIWGALLHGGRLVIVSKDTVLSPSDFYKLVCRSGVTILNQTPSAFLQFIVAQSESKELHKLRYVIFGGEALETSTLKPWYDRNDGDRTQLINMYGITETTVHVTYHPLDRTDTERRGGSPIGRRIPDLKTYILDGEGRPVPIGVPGEIHVSGAGLARGYLNRPELTAERFVGDPYSPQVGARMYRTGDLARWLPDGTIDYLGRNDFQVKVRGYRIELGEIEARLRENNAIREAVVVAREDTPGDKRLVAYLVARNGGAAVVELRDSLRAKLPEYMVPAAFVFLDKLPLTPNGKLDRKALPKPDIGPMADKFVAPTTPSEIALAKIWCEILALNKVGVHDNFFDLGGHSLLSLRLMAAIDKTFGSTLTAGSLFANPTISQLSKVVQLDTHSAAQTPLRGITGRGANVRLFYIPGAYGYELLPAGLARQFGDTFRFYDRLQYPGFDGTSPIPGSVEEIATYLITQIRTVWPNGPYYLCGWSFGGVMAFEVARQLKLQGANVGTAFLLDSRFPGSKLRKRSTREIVALFRRHLATLSGLDRLVFFRDLIVNKIRFVWFRSRRHFFAPTAVNPSPLYKAVMQLRHNYQPEAYDGKVVLFQMEAWEYFSGFRYAQDPAFGWGRLVRSGIEVVQVPGDHFSLLNDPSVADIAARIRSLIEDARAPAD